MSSVLKVKKNQKGGYYAAGKSLSMEVRAEIVQRFIRKEKVTQIAKDMKLTHGVVSKITQHYRKTGLIAPRNVKSVNETTVTVPKPRNKLPFSVESILSQPTTAATSTASTPSSVSSTTSDESVNFSTSPAASDGTLPLNMNFITLMAMAQMNLTAMPPMQQVPIVPPPQVQALQMQMDAIALNQWLVDTFQFGFRQ